MGSSSRAGGKFVVFTKNLSPNNSLALLCLPHIFSPNCSPLNLLSASEPVVLCTFLVSFFIFSVPRIFQLVFVLEMVYSLIKRFPRYLKVKGFSETWNEWSLSTRSKENAQGKNLFQLTGRPSALLSSTNMVWWPRKFTRCQQRGHFKVQTQPPPLCLR